MAAEQETKTLLSLAITTAVTATATTAVSFWKGPVSLELQATFTYGAGGTTADAYIQTSLDLGVTWIDIANFHFTTATLRRVVNLTNIAASPFTPTDGALTANTAITGVLGTLYRVKYVTTGTYSGSTTLVVTAQSLGGSGIVSQASLTEIINNQAYMMLDIGNVRPRAYPWDTGVSNLLTASATTNTFGTRVKVITKATFDFGDTPNYIRVKPIIEAVSDTDVYVLELESTIDGVNFTPVYSARFTGSTVYTPTFDYSRAFIADTYDLYARIKAKSTGGVTATIALSVYRFIPTSVTIIGSSGNNFPFN